MSFSFIGGGSGENRHLSQVTDKIYHIILYRVHITMSEFKLTTIVVIDTDSYVVVNPTTIQLRPRQSHIVLL